MKQLSLFSIAIVWLSICLTSHVSAQGVGINSSGSPPDPSAILDASSTTQGQLMPRMTTIQRDAIVSPAPSLMIYNQTTRCLEIYEGGTWQALSCIGSLPGPAGTITGTSTVCQGQTSVAYFVPAIPYATSYTWTFSGTGVTINGSSNSVTLDFSVSATSGNLTVSGTNSYGNGTVSPNFSIAVNPLPVAAGTISGSSLVFLNQTGVPYSVPVISNAASYSWQYSGTGATINGTSNSITIDFSGSATSGNLTVRGVNSCGNGALSANFPITVDATPHGSQTFIYTGSDQTFTVPAGVTSLTFKVWGAGGGSGGGLGASDPKGGNGGGAGHSTGSLTTSSGTIFTVIVGQAGQYSNIATNYGGGGAGGFVNSSPLPGGSGGGRSAIRNNSSVEIITAGGGGGGGGACCAAGTIGGNGGAGGGSSGQNGFTGTATILYNAGGGGTQVAGGSAASGSSIAATAGSQYQGGNGGGVEGSSNRTAGGGGGGGYYGGGGGAGNDVGSNNVAGGGGGAGSSYIGGVTGGSTQSGSGVTPGNSGDVDRGNAGNGGTYPNNGEGGLVIIAW